MSATASVPYARRNPRFQSDDARQPVRIDRDQGDGQQDQRKLRELQGLDILRRVPHEEPVDRQRHHGREEQTGYFWLEIAEGGGPGAYQYHKPKGKVAERAQSRESEYADEHRPDRRGLLRRRPYRGRHESSSMATRAAVLMGLRSRTARAPIDE